MVLTFLIFLVQTLHSGMLPYECPRYGCDKTFAKNQKLQVTDGQTPDSVERVLIGIGFVVCASVSDPDPHKEMPRGSGSAWTYADPDPGGKKA